MHSGSSVTPNNPAFSVSVGLAALVIEGRPLFDNEYATIINDAHNPYIDNIGSHASSSSASGSSSLNVTPQTPPFGFNPYRSHGKNSLCSLSSSSSSLSSSVSSASTPVLKQDSVQHLQRLRQKLHQLRSSPSTSRDLADQGIAIAVNSPPTAANYDSDEELELIYKKQASSLATPTLKDVKIPLLQKPKPLNSLQLLAATATTFNTTPRSFSEHSGLLQTVESWTGNKMKLNKLEIPLTPSTPSSCGSSSSCSAASSSATSTPVLTDIQIAKLKAKARLAATFKEKGQCKQLGPHCELFLKKIGLVKGSCHSESTDFDDHYCVRTNEHCFRWQQHYKQLVSVFSKNEPICVEVFLGPENNAILLEQWIIIQNEDSTGMQMTLQSLCSAIRSQLHFSQITAWSDLLRNASPFDNDIKSNPRIKNASKLQFRPKLDVLYRIRPYDSSSCFISMPIEHNFPDTPISEHVSLKISVKSLPRMKHIPQLQDFAKVPSNFTEDIVTVQPMLLHDRAQYLCNEKGKHRCTFDEESPNDELTSHRDKQLQKYKKLMMRRDKKRKNEEGAISLGSVKPKALPSHTTTITDTSNGHTKNLSSNCKQYNHTINPNRPPLYSTLNHDVTAANGSHSLACATVTTTPSAMSLAETNTIATSMTIGTNLASNPMTTKSTQTSAIEMTTVATQTENANEMFPSCDFCGIEMQYFCWNCDKKMFTESCESQKILDKADLLLKAIQRTPSTKQQSLQSAKNFNSNNKNQTAINGKLEIDESTQSMAFSENNNSSMLSDVSPPCDISKCDNGNKSKNLDTSDCRSCCKRQKTNHNYFPDNITSNNYCHSLNSGKINKIISKSNNNISQNGSSNSLALDTSSSKRYDDDDAIFSLKKELGDNSGNYRRTMSESVVGACHMDNDNCTNDAIDLATYEMMNMMSDNELKLYRRAYSEDELICNCDDNRPKAVDSISQPSPPKFELPLAINNSEQEFKTPTLKHHTYRSKSPSNNQTDPIYIKCHSHTDYVDDTSADAYDLGKKQASAKQLAKVNLTKFFTASDDHEQIDGAFKSKTRSNPDLENKKKLLQMSSEIPVPVFSFNNIFDFDNLSPPLPSPTSGAVVQKSNSAPTFHHSPPTLSPRFLKSAAAYKRRSRHLSDRSSERLSVGSDEHLSDEEFHQYGFDTDSEYRPGISPTKATLKLFPKNYAFRKRALLGSFEESLLQRRFEPKFLVPGYKVLLGASGCYCTNQITIPAYTFFYELNAEHLSTPYVCEVSMPPRKGYVIPRTGHVQATLLNPNGMVVRMFVVAYDFRDMPAMSQTFVRQRILSFDENANPGKSVDDLTASEQMKQLRYAIHLRFQSTRSGRLALHSDIRMLISRRTDCDTAAAHAKGALESPSELKTVTIVPENPRFSPR